MSDSPYEPPRAPLKDQPQNKRSNLLAIILGALVDLITTVITGVLLQVAFGIVVGSAGMSVADLVEMMQNSTVFAVLGSVIGLSCSVLGGYVCARFANQNEYANGLAVGLIGILSGFALNGNFTNGFDNVDALTFLLALATVPAALLGAHLKVRRDKVEAADEAA